LSRDAVDIWRAGVAAVDSEKLVRDVIDVTPDTLRICGHEFPFASLGRIAVVGAGKAGAGMAAGLEAAVGPKLLAKVTGWVNVPADCVRPLSKIRLHAARPAGLNEPMDAGVKGGRAMLDLVSHLNPRDLCVVLLSGGGSALLPAPPDEISLADKQAVTRLLMQGGASIEELNCVRKHLSRIKGGRLAQASRAGSMVSLVISDIVGDPLDAIASGPTVPDTTTAAEALTILRRYARRPNDLPESVVDYLAARAAQVKADEPFPDNVHNHVIGSNAVALEAAERRAEELGYRVQSLGSENRGEARNVGRELAELCVSIRDAGSPVRAPACVLSGGEPVVHVEEGSGKGGRNQEVVLAALDALWNDGCGRIAVLSGGTDGEDGPTDAAGAVADADAIRVARAAGLHPREFLATHDSYAFFDRAGGLIKTGPTHTNVMDVRVALVGE
jgi:glycerate-2-kinase